jgi:sugar-phosphatase
MDGLLIDSEWLWREGEALELQAVGVPMTAADGMQTIGLRCDEVVEYWYARHPWTGATLKEVEARIDRRVLDLVREKGVPNVLHNSEGTTRGESCGPKPAAFLIW